MLPAITVLAIAGNILLGLFVFQKNPKSTTNVLFFLSNIINAFWAAANYLSLSAYPFNVDTLFAIRLVLFFAAPHAASFFLLIVTFPNESIRLPKKILYSYLTLLFAIMIAALSPFVFTHLVETNGVLQPVPGPLMPLFGLFVVISIISGFITLIYKYRKASGTSKAQLQFILTGTAAMFALILFTIFFPVVFFGNSGFVQFSPVYTYPFVGAVAYAIVKHRLLDVGFVVARAVSFTLLIGVLGLLYSLIFGVLSAFFSGSQIAFRTIAVSTLLALIMAFSFQYIRRILEKITDRVLYKDRYDTSKLLYDLALIMASTLRLENLTHQILQNILSQMRISRGAFILTEKEMIYEVAHEGFKEFPDLEESKINKLIEQNKTLVFDELEEGSAYKDIMRVLNLYMALPLETEGEYLGLMVFGEKLNGEIYSNTDIKTVEIIASQAAVAIQNAKAYEEIRRFNITLQKEVEQATKDLRIANAKLQDLDRLKDDFVSVASHELRTPMTAIRSYAWMALNRSDIPLSEKLKRYLTRTLISTERLINLVNDMLNVSRIESGRVKIVPKTFSIVDLVSEVITEIGAKMQERSVNITISNPNVPEVFADPDKVHQVLLNLTGNALKFTPEGSSIYVSFFSDGKFVDVSVKDTGVGITKDDLGRLFAKFGRLDNSYVAAATSGGTGLGLYISKSLIELMKGRIWVTSEGLGKGATFSFSLPVATPDVLAQAAKYSSRVQKEQVKFLEPVAI